MRNARHIKTTPVGEALIAAARQLRAGTARLQFQPPVTHVYNPLVYAWGPHAAYLGRFGATCKRVVFLGMNPGPILGRGKLLEEILPPDVPPGLPATLLERRPDIRQAEQLVRSANAQVGVVKAYFYPQFSLTGLFGRISPEASAFTAGGADAWSAAANVAGPLFEAGLLKGELKQARAAWDEAVLQYQSSVLNALQEVSDALSAREQLRRERIDQQRAVRAYEEAVRVAGERYQAGHANYYELLQEQQLLFPAENALTQTELNQLLAIVQLYRALGGGWR